MGDSGFGATHELAGAEAESLSNAEECWHRHRALTGHVAAKGNAVHANSLSKILLIPVALGKLNPDLCRQSCFELLAVSFHGSI